MIVLDSGTRVAIAAVSSSGISALMVVEGTVVESNRRRMEVLSADGAGKLVVESPIPGRMELEAERGGRKVRMRVFMLSPLTESYSPDAFVLDVRRRTGA